MNKAMLINVDHDHNSLPTVFQHPTDKVPNGTGTFQLRIVQIDFEPTGPYLRTFIEVASGVLQPFDACNDHLM